jgi:hypothetical protein
MQSIYGGRGVGVGGGWGDLAVWLERCVTVPNIAAPAVSESTLRSGLLLTGLVLHCEM